MSPDSKLFRAPNERVTIDFLLTNSGPENRFYVSVQDSGFPNVAPQVAPSPDAIVFDPQPKQGFRPQFNKLLESISEQDPILFANETRTIAVNLLVPAGIPVGALSTLTIEIQAQKNFATGNL